MTRRPLQHAFSAAHFLHSLPVALFMKLNGKAHTTSGGIAKRSRKQSRKRSRKRSPGTDQSAARNAVRPTPPSRRSLHAALAADPGHSNAFRTVVLLEMGQLASAIAMTKRADRERVLPERVQLLFVRDSLIFAVYHACEGPLPVSTVRETGAHTTLTQRAHNAQDSKERAHCRSVRRAAESLP